MPTEKLAPLPQPKTAISQTNPKRQRGRVLQNGLNDMLREAFALADASGYSSETSRTENRMRPMPAAWQADITSATF